MATEEIDVRVRLKDDLSKPLKRTEEQVKRTSEETDGLGDSTDQMSEKQRRAALRAQRLENAEKRVAAQTAKLGEQTERLAKKQAKAAAEEEKRLKQLRYAGTLIGKLDNKTKKYRTGLSLFGREIGRTVKALVPFRRIMMSLMVAGFISAINLAIGAIGGLAAAASGAIGALSPMIGILGGIPAMAVGASLAIGVMKTAMSGIGAAVKALSDPKATIKDINEATKGLSPAAKAFAVQVANIKAAWVPVRDAVQQATLPLVGQAMQRVVYTYLPFMQRELSALGHLFGQLAVQASKSLTTLQWQKDLGFLFAQNRILTEKWAHVFGNLAGVIRDIAVSAAPMMRMFADWALRVSQRMENWFAAARKSGKLTKFFNEAYHVTHAVAGVAWDLFVALHNIFSIGAGLGKTMGRSLADMAKQFRAWTQSEAGRKQIAAWFAKMKPIVFELGRLVRDVVKAFFRLTEMPGMKHLIKQVRTKLLPVLEKLLKTVGVKLGSALVDLASSLGELANTVAAGGLMTNLIGLVGALNTIAKLFNMMPGPVQRAITFITAFLFLSKASGWGKMVVNLYNLGKWFKTTTIGMDLFSIAGKVMNAVLAGLEVVMGVLLSPIGLVVLAIAALVVGFIIAYKKSETFRKIVNAAFKKVGEAGQFLWDKMLRPAFKFIVDTWLWVAGMIIHGAAAAFGWVPKIGDKLKGAAKSFDAFKDSVNRSLDGIKDTKDIRINLKGTKQQLAMVPGYNKPRYGAAGPGALFAGGPMQAGKPYVVGELGPELLKTASGMQWLGLNGPELVTSPQGGTVIPNHEIAQHLPTVPPPPTPREPRGGTATATAATPPINIHLYGDNSALTPADVEAAAMRAYRRFERERRERT